MTLLRKTVLLNVPLAADAGKVGVATATGGFLFLAAVSDGATLKWNATGTTWEAGAKVNPTVLSVLAGPPVTHNSTGWKVVGTIAINPAQYAFTTTTVEYLCSTTDIGTRAIMRLWNVTTAAQIGTEQTSSSVSTTKVVEVISLTAGLNIYEVQMHSQTEGVMVICAGADILLT